MIRTLDQGWGEVCVGSVGNVTCCRRIQGPSRWTVCISRCSHGTVRTKFIFNSDLPGSSRLCQSCVSMLHPSPGLRHAKGMKHRSEHASLIWGLLDYLFCRLTLRPCGTRVYNRVKGHCFDLFFWSLEFERFTAVLSSSLERILLEDRLF